MRIRVVSNRVHGIAVAEEDRGHPSAVCAHARPRLQFRRFGNGTLLVEIEEIEPGDDIRAAGSDFFANFSEILCTRRARLGMPAHALGIKRVHLGLSLVL